MPNNSLAEVFGFPPNNLSFSAERYRKYRLCSYNNKVPSCTKDQAEVMVENINCHNRIFFIDPPYTAAGKKAGSRLYRYWQLNHQRLFEIASNLAGDFMMSYDDTLEVRNWSNFYGFKVRNVGMKNTHNTKMTELLIGRNLDWVE